MRVLLFLSTLLALCALGSTFRFPLVNKQVPGLTALIPATPRPMFSKADAPFSLFGEVEPTIRLTGTISATVEAPTLTLFHIVSDFEFPILGAQYEVSTMDYQLCSGKAPVVGEVGGAGTTATGEKVIKYYESPVVQFEPVAGPFKNVFKMNKTLVVNVTGYHYVLITNCNENLITIKQGSLDFRNPHGYLPGGWYLKLPLTGLIMICYAVLTVVYIIRCMMYREHILYLQYAIIAVLMMGLIEQSAYFFTFLEMNDVGDLPCCPVRHDIVFCLMVSVLKRGTLVTFLLAVSLGYGTAKPTLTRRDTIAVIGVGFLYVVASINFEYRVILSASSQKDETGSSDQLFLFSALFVSVCNVTVISWIYFSITELIQRLKDEGQSAKLHMYEKLARALLLWVVIGFLFEVLFYMIASSAISMHWKYGTLPKFSW